MMYKIAKCLSIFTLVVIIIFCLRLLFNQNWWENSGSNLDYDLSPEGLGHPKIQEITKNVLALTGLYHSSEKGFSTNAGIIFTPQSIIFIDAGMTIASGEFLWTIAQERMKANEDLYLILTHHHGDHVFGMRVMKEKGAKVIAHRIVKEWFKEYDGEEIHLLVTPGHTTDSISVYHPGSKTLFAGDTIYEGTRPNTRFSGPEEWKIWIAQLERLKKLEIDTIVPGHGKICGKEEIDHHIDYLKKLL